MKAIRIASTGGLEVLESDYVRTHKEPTAIMDVVFEMYITKELEVLIKPAYALEDAGEAHRYLERRKSHRETPTFYRGVEHGAKENQDAYSKRTPKIQNDPNRNGLASPQP